MATSGLRFGPDYLIPKPFDPRLIERDRAGGRARRRWTAASPRARSPTSTPTAQQLAQFVYHSGASMKPVFAAAKRRAEARRLCRGRGRARAARGAGRGRRRPRRGPILIGRPDVIAARIEQLRPAPAAPGDDCEIVNSADDPRYARRAGASTTSSRGASGVTRAMAQRGDAQPPHADRRDAGAPRRCRRDAVRHVGGYSPTTCDYVRDVIGLRDGAQHAGRDEHADPAGPPALHLRHLRQSRPDRRADRRDHAARGRGGAALRHHAERGAAVAFELRQLRRAVRAARCARRWR